VVPEIRHGHSYTIFTGKPNGRESRGLIEEIDKGKFPIVVGGINELSKEP
jgi:hypothetical protein